jgi:hypothetical protein
LACGLTVSAKKVYWWRQRLRADARSTELRFMEVQIAAQSHPAALGTGTITWRRICPSILGIAGWQAVC